MKSNPKEGTEYNMLDHFHLAALKIMVIISPLLI
jgi:hypothetical protein